VFPTHVTGGGTGTEGPRAATMNGAKLLSLGLEPDSEYQGAHCTLHPPCRRACEQGVTIGDADVTGSGFGVLGLEFGV
jgi:hypothetical protein